ncbi:MAG: DUF2911 domain-containing protein [Bacteroidota bacterium]
MKKIFLMAAVLFAVTSFGQGRKSPHDTVSTKDVTVTYGRPYKKDRVVFGQLEKFGKVWRVGADEATTIRFSKDTKFGSAEIPAGTYTLCALLNENEWTIILNSVLGQWGAFDYEKNKDKNVAEINVPVKKLDSPVEQLTIRFEKEKTMIIEWDQTQVQVSVKPK